MDWAIVEIEEVLVVMLDEGEWEIYFQVVDFFFWLGVVNLA